MEESSPVLRERADDIEIVRLNRPGKRNALDTATLAALTATLDELAADTTLRVLVLSTSSVAAFCAGADVTERLDHEAGVARMAAFARLYTQLDEFPAPVISVLVGNCVGAGAEIIAASDLRVGGDNLRLAWAGARLGVPVGPARLVPLIGMARAKDLILTGRVVGMEEAREFGLLQRTAAAGEAETVALELAAQVARQDRAGLRLLKQMFRELDSSGQRVAYENAHLMRFQQHGVGLPGRR